MPYKLRKSPQRNMYWVVNEMTGRKYSYAPLPKSRAEAQMRALYAVENGYILTRSAKSKSRKSRKSMRKMSRTRSMRSRSRK